MDGKNKRRKNILRISKFASPIFYFPQAKLSLSLLQIVYSLSGGLKLKPCSRKADNFLEFEKLYNTTLRN